MAQDNTVLPTDSLERKGIPLMTGVFDYFPAILAEVAKVSKAGNDKHNPGEPLHHARGKSSDHVDAALRHLAERGKIDTAWPAELKIRHIAEAAWRVLAEGQEEMESLGAPLARGAKEPKLEPVIDEGGAPVMRCMASNGFGECTRWEPLYR